MGKEITRTNAEFLNAYKTLELLLSTTELNTKVNWNLSKNFDSLESFCKRYDKCKIDILNKYVLRDETGKIKADENNNPRFAPRMENECIIKQNELLECEETMDLLTVRLDELPDKLGKGINLKYINFMIDDTESKETKPETK